MAALWILTTAIESLRRRLSDGSLDKYVHQMDVDPEPDGVTVRFAVPDSRLVTGTLLVTKNGVAQTPATINLDDGSFDLSAAPAVTDKLFASYYFQWFNDDELEEFLLQALQMLGYDSVEDTAVPLQHRTVALSFAAYYAYMKKAAQTADALVASSSGFTSDTSKQHPYWMDMAKMAWEQAQKELETANTITPVGTVKPAMKFATFRVPRYVPRS